MALLYQSNYPNIWTLRFQYLGICPNSLGQDQNASERLLFCQHLLDAKFYRKNHALQILGQSPVQQFFGVQLSGLMTKPTKWHVHPVETQISLGIRPVWSESSLSAWRNIGSSATHWAPCQDSDQTGQMPRLFWVFAERNNLFVGFVMRWHKCFWMFTILTGSVSFFHSFTFFFSIKLDSSNFLNFLDFPRMIKYIIVQSSSIIWAAAWQNKQNDGAHMII